MPELEINEDAGVFYVKFKDAKHFDEGIGIDAWVVFDIKDNKIVGIEIVPKSRDEFNRVVKRLEEADSDG